MASFQQWEKEVQKMSKDELTTALSAYERLCKWGFFAGEFQLGHFTWVAEEMKQRVEWLAERDEMMEDPGAVGCYRHFP